MGAERMAQKERGEKIKERIREVGLMEWIREREREK